MPDRRFVTERRDWTTPWKYNRKRRSWVRGYRIPLHTEIAPFLYCFLVLYEHNGRLWERGGVS